MKGKSKFNFGEVASNLSRTKSGLLKLLASDSKNYFMEAFKNEEWDGNKWKQVDRKIPGTKAYKYPSRPKTSAHSRLILVGTGRLRKAVANSKKTGSMTNNSFTLVVADVPYAEVHNEGLKTRFFTMPKRQFMGDTKALRNIQLARIHKYMDRVWQG